MSITPENINPPGNAILPNGEEKSATRESGVPRDGWHSRGYLPHFNGRELTQHVTYHLADSLPQALLKRLDEEIYWLPKEQQGAERRKRVDAWMDAGYGACVLREPALAEMVQNSFFHFDGQRYRLLAWVVMPNHVHVVFQPLHDWTVAQIVASWKKFTAARIHAFLRSQAHGEDMEHVWHREYWDRFIRDARHFQQAVEYVHQNPVKAGLAVNAEDWHWSSAFPSGSAILPNGEKHCATRESGVPGDGSHVDGKQTRGIE